MNFQPPETNKNNCSKSFYQPAQVPVVFLLCLPAAFIPVYCSNRQQTDIHTSTKTFFISSNVQHTQLFVNYDLPSSSKYMEIFRIIPGGWMHIQKNRDTVENLLSLGYCNGIGIGGDWGLRQIDRSITDLLSLVSVHSRHDHGESHEDVEHVHVDRHLTAKSSELLIYRS